MRNLSALRVHIVGGGIAGLAVGYHVASQVERVTFYDMNEGPGVSGASVVSAGLLHPITTSGKLMWRGNEAYTSARNLLNAVQMDNITTKLSQDSQLFHNFYSSSEFEKWQAAAKLLPDYIECCDITKLDGVLSSINNKVEKPIVGSIRIKNACIVNSPLYLKCLYQSILKQNKHTSWVQHTVNDTNDYQQLRQSPDDIIVITAGPGIRHLWPHEEIENLQYAKGQNLIYSSDDIKVDNGYISGEYIVPSVNNDVIYGASYEYSLDTLEKGPDISGALKYLNRSPFYTNYLHDKKITRVTAGIRVVPKRGHKGKLPVVLKHKTIPNVYCITGFGSRGLLYHSFIADLLVKSMLSNDDSILDLVK